MRRLFYILGLLLCVGYSARAEELVPAVEMTEAPTPVSAPEPTAIPLTGSEFDKAMSLSMSSDVVDQATAQLLFEQLARQNREEQVARNQKQGEYLQMNKDMNGFSITGGQSNQEQLSASQREQLAMKGVDPREVERLLRMGQYQAVGDMLTHNNSPMTDEQRAEASDRALRIHSSSWAPRKEVTETPPPTQEYLGVITPERLPVIEEASLGGLGGVKAAGAIPSDEVLNDLMIKKPTPGMNIFEKSHFGLLIWNEQQKRLSGE